MTQRLVGIDGLSRSVMPYDPEVPNMPLLTQDDREQAFLAGSIGLFANGFMLRTLGPAVEPQIPAYWRQHAAAEVLTVGNGNHRTSYYYLLWKRGALIGDDVIGTINGQPLTKGQLASLFDEGRVVTTQGYVGGGPLHSMIQNFDPARAKASTKLNPQGGIVLCSPRKKIRGTFGATIIENNGLFKGSSGMTLDEVSEALVLRRVTLN